MAKTKTSFGKGHAKVGGRKKGSLNKATRTIKEMAEPYGEEMIGILVDIARNSEYDPGRIAAAKAILDRAYGLAVQPVETTVTHNIKYEISLEFGQPAQDLQSEDALPARISGPARNGSTVGYNGSA